LIKISTRFRYAFGYSTRRLNPRLFFLKEKFGYRLGFETEKEEVVAVLEGQLTD